VEGIGALRNTIGPKANISVRNSVGVGNSSGFPSWPIVLPLVIEHHLSENQQVISTLPTPILSSQFQAAVD